MHLNRVAPPTFPDASPQAPMGPVFTSAPFGPADPTPASSPQAQMRPPFSTASPFGWSDDPVDFFQPSDPPLPTPPAGMSLSQAFAWLQQQTNAGHDVSNENSLVQESDDEDSDEDETPTQTSSPSAIEKGAWEMKMAVLDAQIQAAKANNNADGSLVHLYNDRISLSNQNPSLRQNQKNDLPNIEEAAWRSPSKPVRYDSVSVPT